MGSARERARREWTTEEHAKPKRSGSELTSDDDATVEVPLRIPRSALTVVEAPPSHLSQRTCERFIGVPRAPFLRLVRQFAQEGGEVIEAGKLRLVGRVAFIGWLRTRRGDAAENMTEPLSLLTELGVRIAAEVRR